MRASLRMIEQLSGLIGSKPVVTICLSGRSEFNDALQGLGLTLVVKNLNFNHMEWANGLVAESKVTDEELDKSTGLHLLKDSRKHVRDAVPIGDDSLSLLALLFKQHKREFLLSKHNYYLIVQDTVHTGVSLNLVKKALVMNGIPERQVVTAAFRTSISTVFPPDVFGEQAFLSAPEQRKPDSWVRVAQGEKDLLLKIPML